MDSTTTSPGRELATQHLHTRQGLMQTRRYGHLVLNDAKI